MLLVAKKGQLAILMYNKLRACAHTDNDAVTKMYAYKQMGYTYCFMEKYESAIIAFKHLLGLAWTIKSPEGELAAYEGLSLMYLYIGQIQKSKFFEARISHGYYQPYDSQLYKITVSSTLNDNRWLKKENPVLSKGLNNLDIAIEKADDMQRLGTHFSKFFADRLRDYSLLRPETMSTLTEVSAHFQTCHDDGNHI